MICNLCPRKCGAYRDETRGEGFCKMPTTPAICRAELHFGEEPVISGKKGSGTIFFTGCNLGCVYCQNIEISRDYKGKRLDVQTLVEVMKSLEEKGAENISFVTATPFVETVISALKIYKPCVPTVYNCGGYESVETLRRLEGLIDVYLPDFKYSIGEIAKKYSFAEDYPEVATKAIAEMYRQCPENTVENGVMKKGVIIRHLVLPSNRQNSFGVIDKIYENFGKDACVSLMAQFTPNGCDIPELSRKITTFEYEKVRDYMLDKGMENGFSQTRDSSGTDYLPEWNLIN